MKNNVTDTKRILFNSKGMPSKMRNFLLIFGIVFLVITILGFAGTMSLPTRNAFNSGVRSNTQLIDGKAVVTFSSTPGITEEMRSKCMLIFLFIFILGVMFLSCMIGGRKFYFRIYEDHIEGCSGFGFLSKNINIQIKQIGEISSNMRGMMPSIVIRTVHGNNVGIFMNADKVSEAERILRRMLNSQLNDSEYEI